MPYDAEHELLCTYITLPEDIEPLELFSYAGMAMQKASELKERVEPGDAEEEK